MIIDASVAVHWFSPSEFSLSVQRFRGRSDLTAPSFLLIETSNVLYKHARAGRIDAARCEASLRLLEMALRGLVSDRELLPDAIQLALSMHHPVYDCLYIALANSLQEPLATCDKRMAALARNLGLTVDLITPASA